MNSRKLIPNAKSTSHCARHECNFVCILVWVLVEKACCVGVDFNFYRCLSVVLSRKLEARKAKKKQQVLDRQADQLTDRDSA